MKIRTTVFATAAIGLAALTGAAQPCAGLPECLPDGGAITGAAAAIDDAGMTAEGALAVDRRLTALIGG